MRLSMLLPAAVALYCFGAACSSGLGGLHAAPGDAGNADGGGSGGASGSDGSAGTGASGGAAGSGGVAGKDAGGDASDAGTFKCSPEGAVFSVLTSAELGSAPLDAASLRVVEASGANGNHPAMYVVVSSAAQSGATTSVFVRAIVDSASNHLGGMASSVSNATFHIVSGYADSTTLHALGWEGTNLAEVDFPVDASGGVQKPTTTTLKSNICPTSIAGACFMRSGTSLREVVTCEGPAGNGSTVDSLYLDGQLVGSGSVAQQSLVVRDCVALGSTLVLRTGPDYGNQQLRYGANAAALTAAHPFSLTTDAGRMTVIGPLVPTPAADGIAPIAMTLALPSYTPMDFYTGVVPLADFADLDKVPVPELKQGATVTSTKQLVNYASADAEPAFTQYAGSTFNQDAVDLVVVGSGGKLLVFGQPVYTTTQSLVAGAAIGTVGTTSVAVWIEQNTDGSNTRVNGQALFCAKQ